MATVNEEFNHWTIYGIGDEHADLPAITDSEAIGLVQALKEEGLLKKDYAVYKNGIKVNV